MVDLNMKWNEYPSDSLYLWNGKTLFVISEGTGDNLLPEDEEEGYVDYWITQIFSMDAEDGGQWLEKGMIYNRNYTLQEVLDRIGECDLWDDEWKLLSDEEGKNLMWAYEEYHNKLRETQIVQEELKQTIAELGKGD